MLLPDSRDYDELRRTFRWEIPENFNIAHYTCDRWAASTPDRPAILHKRSDGTVHPITCLEFQRLANRVANLLTSHGIERGDRVAILLPQSPETA